MRLTLYTDLCLRLLMSLARSDIRAVVTDINLGSGSNGWQVAKRARELHHTYQQFTLPAATRTNGQRMGSA